MDNSTTTAALSEPLLSSQDEQQLAVVTASLPSDGDSSCPQPEDRNNDAPPSNEPSSDFSIQSELMEMLHLGIPLAVSFFCRMVRKKQEQSMCLHLTYLAHTQTHSICHLKTGNGIDRLFLCWSHSR